MTISTNTGLELPGFGLPLDFKPKTPDAESLAGSTLHKEYDRQWCDPFPSALEGDNGWRLTPLREFTMMRFMNTLTDKPGWDTKIFDETIAAKWKDEALSSSNIDMTQRMFSYCIDELRWKSKLFQETGIVSVYDGDVVKSDVVIPPSLNGALRAAVAPLEDIPDFKRDWHPGSNETVLDLIHPSLFPVVYGQTRILKDSVVGLDDCVKRCGEGVTLPTIDDALKNSKSSPWNQMPVTLTLSYSYKFQWLPCEVKFDSDGAKIASYINNLHPQIHKSLYGVIEQIIGLTIPLWNHTLAAFGRDSTPRVPYSRCTYDPDPEAWPEEEHPQILPGESLDEYWYRKERWFEDTRRVVLPEPEDFTTPKFEEIPDLRKVFAEKGLQVIVKLANIHLTPEKPEYGGGTWHVEGQLNEHICATALYYYDNSNITESLLSFRQQSFFERFESDIWYKQDHHDWLPAVFGCQQGGSTVQYIGDIVTKEGRLLTFPNIFQHRVGPFELVDKTKPGHRKILALFLVDPHFKIISSENVPCQRRDWWMQELQAEGVFAKLPEEMIKEVVDNVEEFPISLDDAKKLRLELMQERTKYVYVNEWFTSLTFSLCEH